MSCHWKYECTACGESFDPEDRSNHQSEVMASILAARPELEQAGLALMKAPGLLAALRDFFGTEWSSALLAWFAEHAGHPVRLVDEYGLVHGTCGERLEGGETGYRYCALPPEHQGGHDPEAKTTGAQAPEEG